MSAKMLQVTYKNTSRCYIYETGSYYETTQRSRNLGRKNVAILVKDARQFRASINSALKRTLEKIIGHLKESVYGMNYCHAHGRLRACSRALGQTSTSIKAMSRGGTPLTK